MDEPGLIMNPFASIDVHPPPSELPIDPRRIERITVACPVRGRGLVVHELEPASEPELFRFFVELVASGGAVDLDSDSPLMPGLMRAGFILAEEDVFDWPRFRVELPAAEPTGRSGWIVADSYLFQPEFALHPGARWPADYEQQDGLLRCFASGPAFWVGDPDELAAPFWLDPDAAAVAARLVPGQPAPAMAEPLAAALAAAGALVPPGSNVAAAPLETHRARFAAERHVVVRNLLGPGERDALRAYYAALLEAGLVRLGDSQTERRFSSYNDAVGRFVHARLAGFMSAVVGRPVLPSFSFFAAYTEGAVLEPHRDRAQAELSISLQIDYAPAPERETGWPLCFELAGETRAADLAIGDAVLYHGRDLVHFRGPLPAAHRSSHLILEYVPADFAGPLI